MCKTGVFCTFFVSHTGMKKIFLFILLVVMATACGTTRRVAADSSRSWVGYSTTDILIAMGDPDRIDDDGRGGSILIYESAPDYDSPDYDILNPDASARKRQYAYFYLDEEGDCYRVDTNRSLPATPGTLSSAGDWSIIFDWLVVFPLLLVFEILL